MSIKQRLRSERDEARRERDELWAWLDDALAYIGGERSAPYPRLEPASSACERHREDCERSLRDGFAWFDEKSVYYKTLAMALRKRGEP